MLLFPPLTVLAASRASGPVAALLAAAVAPFSGKCWRHGFVLPLCLLQNRRCAQLRGFTERLRKFVVSRGDLSDLAAAVQTWRGSDAHDGAKSGDGDLVLKGAWVCLWFFVTLGSRQRPVSGRQSWRLVVFAVLLNLILLFLLIFVSFLFLILIFLLLLHCRPPTALLTVLTDVVIVSSFVVMLKTWGWGELMKVLRGSQGATCKSQSQSESENLYAKKVSLPYWLLVTCVEGTGRTRGRGAFTSASCLLAAMTVTMWAQLLGLALTVFYTVVTAGYLWGGGGQSDFILRYSGKLSHLWKILKGFKTS